MFWHLFLTSLVSDCTQRSTSPVLTSPSNVVSYHPWTGGAPFLISSHSFSSFLVWSMERLLPHTHLQILPLGHAWPGSQPMWSLPCTPLPFPRLAANLIA